MAKLFESSEYVIDMVRNEFAECGLEAYGINLKIMSTVKGKDIISISKASATTEFVSKQEGMIIVTVYEKAFERLDEEKQKLFVEAALSCVSYDSEKDKILLDKSPSAMIHRMRHKYTNSILDTLELNELIIAQIDEEEKEEKERLKQEKANKKKKNNF